MPDDRDLALAKLAVEVGFLSQDEARRYWQQIQAPGAPRLATLLVQEGRLKQGQLDQLRAMFMSRHGTGRVAVATAPPPVAMPGGYATLPEGNDTSTRAVTADEIWAEALGRDRQLAQLLIQRGIVPQERLRECHGIMVQHRVRLGEVLVRKGWADQATIDSLVAQLGFGSSSSRGQQPPPPDPRNASTRPGQSPAPRAGTGPQRRPGNLNASTQPGMGLASGSAVAPVGLGSPSGLAPIGGGLGSPPMVGLGSGSAHGTPPALANTPLASGLAPNPFASVRPGLTPPGLPQNQDDVPTVTEGTPMPMGISGGLATPPAGPGRQDSIPTLLERNNKVAGPGFNPSLDELNPFGDGRRGGVAPTAPEGARPPVSIEELNPFGGIPTEPPPGMFPPRSPLAPPGTDSSAATLEGPPLATPGGPAPGGWGTGPAVFDPSLPPTQEDTTLPPRYPPGGGPEKPLSSPALGAEHTPAPAVRPTKRKGKAKGSSKVTLVIVGLLFLALGLGTVLVLKLVFNVL